MKNLFRQKQNTFYHDYKIIVAAGLSAGIGVDALRPVLNCMDDPLKSKTITLYSVVSLMGRIGKMRQMTFSQHVLRN
jgi:hypothetical protein